MTGQILVDAKRLIAIRDALIVKDVSEAYHQLRMIADPDCKISLSTGEHWTEIEAIAASDTRY